MPRREIWRIAEKKRETYFFKQTFFSFDNFLGEKICYFRFFSGNRAWHPFSLGANNATPPPFPVLLETLAHSPVQ